MSVFFFWLMRLHVIPVCWSGLFARLLLECVDVNRIDLFFPSARLHPDTLATLQRLVHDREVELYDGKRLGRSDGSGAQQQQKGSRVIPIHPAFRIVALGSSSSPSASSGGMAQVRLFTSMAPFLMRCGRGNV